MEFNWELLPNDDDIHHLLDRPQLAYTSRTVHRAFIVWLHCGQQNNFKQVCNYFHYLEDLENKMSLEKRISSRMQEFNLLYKQPPISEFLDMYFPNLYSKKNHHLDNMKQMNEIKLEDCVFNLAGFCRLKFDKAVTTKDKNKTSKLIRIYCKAHCKPLGKLLKEFECFTKKADCERTFDSLTGFIKNKFTEDDLQLYNNISKDFDFLHEDFEEAYRKAKARSEDIKNKPISKLRDNFIFELMKGKSKLR